MVRSQSSKRPTGHIRRNSITADASSAGSAGTPKTTMAGPTKTRSTIFTRAKVTNARRNIDHYPWAKTIANAAIQRADLILDSVSLDDLWRSVTPQSLPRSYAVNQELGSPISGKDIFRFGNYGWLADPLTQPWKIRDPASGYVFPTNDFVRYYESGRDETGEFNPDRADRTLLVNELYPERGETWGVDDGYGWVDEQGSRWTFIAYYIHWWIWYGLGAGAIVGDSLQAFQDAYIYTGGRKYAVPGLVLLDRIADVYPEMDTGAYRREDGFLASDGLRDRGKIVGSIWEAGMCKILVRAYDALFPALADRRAANEIVDFLSDKASTFRLPNPKTTIGQIQASIETGILRQIFPSAQRAQIHGNFGMHQSAVALAAVTLDAPAETRPWIDWIFQGGEYIREPEPRVTGGNMLTTIVNDVDRDGFGDEAAPGYNNLWNSNVESVAAILDGYDGYPTLDLFRHPKFQKMFANWPSLTQGSAFTPSIGDTGATGKPGVIGDPVLYLQSFERYRHPELALHAWYANGMSTEGLCAGIFSDDPAATIAEVETILAHFDPALSGSVNLTGYGFSSLRHRHQQAWLYYGRTSGHGHHDALNLGLHGFGIDLLPDLGYPEFCDLNPQRLEWTENTVSHNTVVVDSIRQQEIWVGTPHNFADTGFVRLTDVEAPGVYPHLERYRRVVAQITVGDVSYLVDIFRIKGGTDHHFSFHAASDTATVDGLTLSPQVGGSYAGADVPFPNSETPGGYRDHPTSGFNWLDTVERSAGPVGTFSVDWPIVDTWNLLPDGARAPHVRLTMVTDVDEVALATGYPPRNKPGNPNAIRYLLAHRHGANLDSQFASIIEAYEASPIVSNVERLAVSAAGQPVVDDVVALRVTLANGRVDTVVSALDPDVRYTIDNRLQFQGAFGVYSEQNGVCSDVFLTNGGIFGETAASPRLARFNGRVLDFTREMVDTNQLIVALDQWPDDLTSLVGLWVYVENDRVRNAVYRIDGASESGGSVALDIGHSTLIRSYRDPLDTESVFVFDVAVNAPITIPLHYHDSV